MALNALIWTLGMDKSEFDKGLLKSKQDVKSTAASFAGSMKGIAMGGAALVGVGGFTALAHGAIELGSELETLSLLAGTTVEEIQRLGAGSKTVGIDTAGLADIYKDVGDKIGDFLTTGAGPMVDFFEQIAPKVGVTAEQFRELSGPEALQLYHDSLRKANVSQNEMKFFMEAIASESTRLIPLLADGGKAFDELGDAAERAGTVMSDKTAADLKAAGAAIEKWKLQATIATGVVLSEISRSGVPTPFTAADSFLDKLTGKAKRLLAWQTEIANLSISDVILLPDGGEQFVELEDRLNAVKQATREFGEAGMALDADAIGRRAVGLLNEKYVELFGTIVEGSEDAAAAAEKHAKQVQLSWEDAVGAAKEASDFARAGTDEQLALTIAELKKVKEAFKSGDFSELGDQKNATRVRDRLLTQAFRLERQRDSERERAAKKKAADIASAAEKEHKRDLKRVDEKTDKLEQADKRRSILSGKRRAKRDESKPFQRDTTKARRELLRRGIDHIQKRLLETRARSRAETDPKVKATVIRAKAGISKLQAELDKLLAERDRKDSANLGARALRSSAQKSAETGSGVRAPGKGEESMMVMARKLDTQIIQLQAINNNTSVFSDGNSQTN